MSYPNITAFKNRPLQEASTTTTGSPLTGTIAGFRCKYLYTIANLSNLVSQTSAGAINLAVNGSTATADAYVTNPIITVTTSTGAVAGGFNSISQNSGTVLYLNQGDILSTVGSSMCPYVIAHVVQEF